VATLTIGDARVFALQQRRLEIEGAGGKSDTLGKQVMGPVGSRESASSLKKAVEDHKRRNWTTRKKDGPFHQSYSGYFALKTKLIGVPSFPVMVISCVCVPRVSCHAVSVYFPGGKLGNVKVPSSPVTE
jgi:hypothetical protein